MKNYETALYLGELLPPMIGASAARDVQAKCEELKRKWDGLGMYIVS